MMRFLKCPKVISLVVIIVLLIQLLQVEGAKITEKGKKHKENRCPEGKDSAACSKSTKHALSDKPSHSNGEVVVPSRRPAFARMLNFAERMVVEFSKEILGFYGLDKNGWEMGILELIVRTVAKDMLFIMQAMNF